MGSSGPLHHVELWVPDWPRPEARGERASREGDGVLSQRWEHGRSWRSGPVYVVLEQSPAMVGDRHDRRSPGMNHMAFSAGTAADLDTLVAEAPAHGWTLLFADRHPWAGGPDHRAAYLEDADGFEVELVATG